MKKILMRSVRAALQLIPSSMKSRLKRSEKLTTFYVTSVRKAGLFFDAPTTKQTQALYTQWLNFKRDVLVSEKKARLWQAVIFGAGQVEHTIESVKNAGATKYFVLSNHSSGFAQLLEDEHFDSTVPVLFLASGSALAPHAVEHFLSAIANRDVGVIYCDTDEIDSTGTRSKPKFFPDWNPDLHFSTAYVQSGVMFDTSLLKHDFLFETKSAAQLLAKLATIHSNLSVYHIPLPLIHVCREESEILEELALVKKEVSHQACVQVSCDGAFKLNKLLWENTNPLVSLIIPTKNGKALVQACIESIRNKTSYSNYEIILIDNASDDPESISYFEELDKLPDVRVLKYPQPFNYSAINNFGVEHAKGSLVALINNDIEVIAPEWLTYMVGHAQRENVGCVGAKLIYSDTRIQHAGVVLGYGGGAGHAHKNFPRLHTGYLNRINATSNYSAVTAACLVVKKTHFNTVNGLNEDLAVAFNDVDFCLRVQALGVRNVYCAEAELFHHESVSRGLDISPEKAARFNKELAYLKTTWSHIIERDPAYSPNLTLKRENFSIKTKEELMKERG